MQILLSDSLTYFGELLSVLSDEELLRLERRFQMRDNPRMAEVLRDEIEKRDCVLEMYV